MKNWIFLDERSEGGISYMIGKRISDNVLYRWEPLASRIHGYELAMFRQNAEKRYKLMHNCSDHLGILPLEKPINHLDRVWIGWEARSGKNPFCPDYERPDLPQLIQDLYPLISAYEHIHYRGGIVGRPDWHRVFHDHKGFFMVDPWCRPYLQSPDFELPNGFIACRTPESYFGDPHAQAGDIFYLGLLIYYLISNHLPFALEDGWPTQAILKGEIIPITYHSPEISPSLARLLTRMLSFKKYERPSALQVKLFWKDLLSRQGYLATPDEKEINLKNYQQHIRQVFVKRHALRWGISLAIGVFCLFSGHYLYHSFYREHPITRQMIDSLYQDHSDMITAPASSTKEPNIFSDIISVRNQRLRLVTELLGRPVVKVEKIAIRKQTNDNAIVDVKLIWWEWRNHQWYRNHSLEVLHLVQKRNKWQIQKRYKEKPL